MKCENDSCEIQMDEPTISVYVADSRGDTTAFWGHYCGYQCTLADMGSTFLEIISQEPTAEPSIEDLSMIVGTTIVNPMVVQGTINKYTLAYEHITGFINNLVYSFPGFAVMSLDDILVLSDADLGGNQVFTRVYRLKFNDSLELTVSNTKDTLFISPGNGPAAGALHSYSIPNWEQDYPEFIVGQIKEWNSLSENSTVYTSDTSVPFYDEEDPF